jgi:predicted AAA+ superfamily ATPase
MKEIVLGQRMERDELREGNYVRREGLAPAHRSIQSPLIKVITGPRRAGKSVFAIQMLKDLDFAYLNFDDERLVNISDYDDLLKAIRQVYGKTKVLFFDEIQNLKNWELFVSRLYRQGYNLILTGSNAHLLSKELATHLTGRHIPFRLFPFSFSEFLKARKVSLNETMSLKENQGTLLNLLEQFFNQGGFPEIILKEVDPKNYLTTLFESILFKDIVKRYNVRFSKKLSDLANYLITHHSSDYSFSRLRKTLDFRSVNTVEKYLSYLTEAFLIFDVERFSFKLKEVLKSPRKVYAYDTGMIQAVKFRISPDLGKLMENLVAIDLLRRGAEFFYYRTSTGKEVDFVVKKGTRIEQMIQVCYNMEDYRTRKREISALVRVAGELGCQNLMILTWDEAGVEQTADGELVIKPLWKWLLETRLKE